ncbi:SUMO1 activating enzyme subunit [Coprinopsis cinerea okayama7|uniref:Ubiquitin-like 1-activating enzyme E1A n=1 Tax=Coprinopsis cinerea (strain Okayama-7 / 130 / ATCC MYA-4618 / FGSC 9003) TaxID=240176 RepID=A8NRS7_COPC7|nr:SUMO1 activating enzyme subunit [Coprinopsis cinerea okayama7\|eukprot:XP_001835845.2 SUMO1 activating enzyme subunit [Coprinopsis cinerea okayama7\
MSASPNDSRTKPEGGATAATLTEEEASRMRNATILVVRLRGVATEAIKNMVLAGIGKLIILDGEEVSEQDLGAGFFFRDEDVGKKACPHRLDVAKPRIESLNPLVTVETIARRVPADSPEFETIIQNVDLVCVTDEARDTLIGINNLCRKYGKPFYSGGTYGIFGYIFCDLLDHEYLVPDRSVSKDQPKTVKATVKYAPLQVALTHKWSGLTRKQTKALNPGLAFSILALWQFQSAHNNILPSNPEQATVLETIANELISSTDVNKQVLSKVPQNLVETLATTAEHEFSPVCAILGGMLGQDILKALGGREPPIANFFVFDGNTGSGTVCRMSMA